MEETVKFSLLPTRIYSIDYASFFYFLVQIKCLFFILYAQKYLFLENMALKSL